MIVGRRPVVEALVDGSAQRGDAPGGTPAAELEADLPAHLVWRIAIERLKGHVGRLPASRGHDAATRDLDPTGHVAHGQAVGRGGRVRQLVDARRDWLD